jgi:ribonucleoside-diphosphate reductase alpha chain
MKMASYKHFQSDNMKYDYKETRTNIFKPEFNPTVSAKGKMEEDNFMKNLPKWVDFISWARFYPDLFFDLITPETGGIRLDLDQRVFLRAVVRFVSVYGVFPRGYGKTFLEVLAMYHTAIFFPDVFLTMTAQTRENAAKLLKEKHTEIIKYYPLLANEITKASFSKDSAEILFTSGGRIDIMANSHSSKGARRHRMSVEEAAQINDELFQDALQPIVTVPRRTIGKEGLVNPEEMNGQICFYTTSWYRGSSEFERNIKMIDAMANLEGVIVLGADWQLACHYGRGETRSQILSKKATMSPIAFALNYSSRWVGASENQLVDINKLLSLRTLTKPENKFDGSSEYYLGVDVARSIDSSNNQSSVVVAKAKRNKNGKITNIMIPNIFTISNALSFNAQAIEVKKIKNAFKAKVVIVDSNGLGAGLVDELMRESFDPQTGESLGCWDTINTDAQPEVSGAEKCLFDLKPQSANSEIIVAFMDMVESGKLRLLEKKQDTDYDINDKENYITNILPFLHTDFLIEEIANLQLKHLPSGKVTVDKLIKKYNKDRFSALAYVLWYIKTYEDNVYHQETDLLETLLKYSYIG